MNKTLIVLGVGIWGVMLILSFVPLAIDKNDFSLLNIIEIVAFIITVAGIVKRD